MTSFDKLAYMNELFFMENESIEIHDYEEAEMVEEKEVHSDLATKYSQHKPIHIQQPSKAIISSSKHYELSTQKGFAPPLPRSATEEKEGQQSDNIWCGEGIKWIPKLTAIHYMYGPGNGFACYPPGHLKNKVSQMTDIELAEAMGYTHDDKGDQNIAQIIFDGITDVRANCAHAPGQLHCLIKTDFIDDINKATEHYRSMRTDTKPPRKWHFPNGAKVNQYAFKNVHEAMHGKKPGWLHLRAYQFVTAFSGHVSIIQNLYVQHHFNQKVKTLKGKSMAPCLSADNTGAVTYHPYNQVQARIATVAILYCVKEIRKAKDANAIEEDVVGWMILRDCLTVKLSVIDIL